MQLKEGQPKDTSERFRPHIKNQLRKELVYDHTHKVERYSGWVNNPEISDVSWGLIKSLDPDHEPYKKHMIRMLHNALPTKGKIWKHIKEEKKHNITHGTNNTFWQDKYPHITDNLCTLCKKETETSEHLSLCQSSF